MLHFYSGKPLQNLSGVDTNDLAGDGTATARVLAQAIAREGHKAVSVGGNPMDIKRGIDLAVRVVVENLAEHARK